MALISNTRIETRLVPVTKETHEHKAPTDESVRLLAEMQQQAAASVLKAFHFKDNALKGIVVLMNRSAHRMEEHIQGRFTLNGREYDFEAAVSDDSFDFDEDTAYEALYDAVSKAVCHAIRVKVSLKI